jgi:hypothetical protein
MHGESWDAMAGAVDLVEGAASGGPGTTVALALEPYGSRIIVFTQRALPARPAKQVVALPAPVDLSGPWSVTFGKDARPVAMEKLHSWTDDEATRFFSGVATYEKKVTVPAEMLKEGISVQLSLGQAVAAGGDTGGMGVVRGGGSRLQARIEAPVREAAVVFVNGKRAGSVWCPPYSVDVTGLLTRGENQIRIEVANLAVNLMAGRPLPDYKTLNAQYGERFQPQDMDQIQPVTSGLLGPIQLVAAREEARSKKGGLGF